MPDVEKSIIPNRIPISVITGFLGSGKTTLIRHLVRQKGMQSTALIINEIGEVGLDHELVETSIENTLLLENGCICCSIRGDLIDTVGDLFAKAHNGQIPKFNRILIETTGLADPAPIVQSLQHEDVISRRCVLDLVVTMVDAVLGSDQLTQYDEAASQITQADTVLLTKSDLCSSDAIAQLKRKISQINPTVAMTEVTFGQIDPEVLFGSTHDRLRIAQSDPHGHHHASKNFSHGEITTCSLVHHSPIDESRLRNWLAMIYSLRPYAMLRLKGIVWVMNSEHPVLIQAVGGMISPPQLLSERCEKQPTSRLVLIFKGMSAEAVRYSFARHVLD